jgi:predicted AAA+ superfamily ATPase
VVAGPRQVGKTTLVRQVLGELALPAVQASADEPALRGRGWIEQQWEAARLLARESGRRGVVLALDEVQKVPGWSETVKRLWDEDGVRRLALKVVVLGSAPLLIHSGLGESPTGRSSRCGRHSAGRSSATCSSAVTRGRPLSRASRGDGRAT